ncbi:MAG TPA: hypothetical protein VG291_03685 [Xanthobacteraceae bacterium]|nr:hypothetical protein [Xanthobacteraceae bacterium]
MITRTLSLLALAAVVSASAATQAMACCGCAYTCAPPAQVQIWGQSPTYAVNQGPVFTGPDYYTSPTFEGDTLTVDYPYVGPGGYPGYYRPYDGGGYTEPFRRRLYHPYWQGALPERPHHFEMLHRHEAGVIYRRGFGRRAITMSNTVRWESRGHRNLRD